jgi:quercetin dioxygenase-like cupin family protein
MNLKQFDYVINLEALDAYSPPLHDGTVNRRLVPAAVGAGIEIVHGTIEPGGMGQRHKHLTEWQIIMLIEGEGVLDIGDEPRQTITAGAVVRIPPDTPHYFEVTGETAAKVIVVYSPPLGPEGFVAA